MTEETKDHKITQRFLLDMKALQERFPTKHDLYTWMVNDGNSSIHNLTYRLRTPTWTILWHQIPPKPPTSKKELLASKTRSLLPIASYRKGTQYKVALRKGQGVKNADAVLAPRWRLKMYARSRMAVVLDLQYRPVFCERVDFRSQQKSCDWQSNGLETWVHATSIWSFCSFETDSHVEL